MKSTGKYIISLILSVLLVFMIIGSAAVIIAEININAKCGKKLASEKNLAEKTYTSIERHYREKSGATGIPAKVYCDAIDNEYLSKVIDSYIDAGFKAMSTGNKFSPDIPRNEKLESSIESFFNTYADETGYEKDEAFEKKLNSTKENAYKTIGGFCDAFKFSAISEHGVMSKISKVYRLKNVLAAAMPILTAAIILLIIFVERKNIKVALFWCGISSLIAGIMGTVPSLWLIADRYYDSFSIKQPQVFSAYTGLFYRLTEAFMAVHIAITVIGISMIVVYGVMCGKVKHTEVQKAVPEEAAEITQEKTE